MAEDVVFFSVLKLAGKPFDVTLSRRTISWVASASPSTGSSGVGGVSQACQVESRAGSTAVRQGTSMMLPYIYHFTNETTGTSETAEVHHYHFVKLSEVITAVVDSENAEDKSIGSTKPRKLNNQDDLTFTVHCVRRNNQGKWRLRELTFECADQDTCRQWVTQIKERITKQGTVRPQNLLVFINPYGGRKEAASIYDSHTAPLFHLAGITTTLIYTEAKNHARDVMLKMDLSEFDGVVCVGGDGTFAEVVNGLLVRTQQEDGIDYSDPEATPRCPQMKIGVIPAGSTDVIVCDTTGVNDPLTSSLQIVLGCTLGLDICSVHSGHQLLRYTVSFMGYGFFGDVLKDSENHRWMGPRRYDFAGFKKYFGNKSYAGEVTFLTSGDEDHHPQDKTKCRVGCAVCLRRSDSQTSDVFDCTHSNMAGLDLQEDNQSLVQESKGSWKKVTGSFCAVNAALVSGCNRLSPNGIAPSSHLGNGCLDLLLVHKCSRFNFLRHLIRLGNSGNHFNFDFVEVHRIKEFTFKALTNQDLKSIDQAKESTSNTSLVKQPQVRYQTTRDSNTSTWNMDGEVCDIPDISVHVHCQLIKIFAYGKEDVKSLNASCCVSRNRTKNKSAWR
ncbi:ceramide kinase-like isoform X2 [Acanthaster planci]|uniref:Ceramide kinase-like isoform X2 n=1 Tax=Acanthaster planci TaxID=133434 RepID=A0A8B8A155_ACAPL|nr:ceramide kinase-like isoform X2 [Acanthaster planci]